MGTGTEEHYASSSDFKKEYVDDGLGGTLYEFGVDSLPANVKDIRGLIIGNPARVFAYLFGEEYDASYFCLTHVAQPTAVAC